MTDPEQIIVAYGYLLAKAVAIVIRGKYGGYDSPSTEMDDDPLLSVERGQAKLTWTGGDYEIRYRQEAFFPLHLLASTNVDLELHFEQLQKVREDETVERQRQATEREKATRRHQYEKLKAEFEPSALLGSGSAVGENTGLPRGSLDGHTDWDK